MGRVIATPLYNYATPLVRYETNDVAVVGDPCLCGRGSPVLEHIVGRSRNLFRFPVDSLIVPEIIGGPLGKYLHPRKWQIAQTGPLELEVRLVLREETKEQDFEQMTGYIRQVLREDLVVKYIFLDEIPLTASEKYEPYVCEVPQDRYSIIRVCLALRVEPSSLEVEPPAELYHCFPQFPQRSHRGMPISERDFRKLAMEGQMRVS